MTNTEIVTSFYEAFRRKDIKTMQSLYADNVVFNDPVFKNLDAASVRSMWEMLIGRGKDMTIDYSIGEASGSLVTGKWTAIYTFSSTGRHVVNHINTTMVVEDGRIVRHTDDFNFPKWATQALGWKGFLFGRMSFLRNKIRTTAMAALQSFIAKK